MEGIMKYEKEGNGDLWEEMYPLLKWKYRIYIDTACGWKRYQCAG